MSGHDDEPTVVGVDPGAAAEPARADQGPDAAARGAGTRVRQVLTLVLPIVLAVALIAIGLPQVAGVGWQALAAAGSRISAGELAVMIVLWWAGLSLQTLVQSAALPGLTYRRSLQLNLSGSAVANVVPAGGAVAMGLNYAMIARWGIPAAGFAQYTLVINLVAAVTKLVLPALAIAALVLVTGSAPLRLVLIAVVALAAAGLVAALVARPGVARGLGRGLDVVTARLGRRVPALRRAPSLAQVLTDLQRDASRAVAQAAVRLPLAAGAYALSQAALLGWCLRAVDAPVTWAVVLTGFAIERALTALPVTPGGTGLAETGATAVLVMLGAPAAPAATAVLVYRAFVVGAEIPVGGLVALAWTLGRGRGPAAEKTVPPSAPPR